MGSNVYDKERKCINAPGSEVARLSQQIELECQAAKLGLAGLAIVANHDSINARMERIWDYRQELAQEVGEQEATKIMHELYVKVVGF